LVTRTREIEIVPGSARDGAAVARPTAARKRASKEVSLRILCISGKERPQLDRLQVLKESRDDSNDGERLLYAKASIPEALAPT